ncbi:hypothetical protein B0H12DRAFT_1231829 [Mycena haematopus]|nr:hypothetical protein B0H12DRAFT_1231829 [Mycena haematopus]
MPRRRHGRSSWPSGPCCVFLPPLGPPVPRSSIPPRIRPDSAYGPRLTAWFFSLPAILPSRARANLPSLPAPFSDIFLDDFRIHRLVPCITTLSSLLPRCPSPTSPLPSSHLSPSRPYLDRLMPVFPSIAAAIQPAVRRHSATGRRSPTRSSRSASTLDVCAERSLRRRRSSMREAGKKAVGRLCEDSEEDLAQRRFVR